MSGRHRHSDWYFGVLLALCAWASCVAALAETVSAEPVPVTPPAAATPDVAARDSICLMIEAAANAHGLPVEFFARVIWQESRFDARAVGPRTRNGLRAQGIAQFMPGTAAERALLDPFDPVQALPKSAEFLRELRAEFGNLGLAAAAYNAGPQRLRNFLAGSGYMPGETRRYVVDITGNSIEEWAAIGRAKADKNRPDPGPGCGALMATLKQAPNPFVTELERRVETAAMRPWGVQLSAGFSRARALESYGRLAKRYGTLLDGQDPVILAATLRSRGPRAFYQVRVGADSRAGADALCTKLRRAGGACMVLRNQSGRPSKLGALVTPPAS
ncbi:MAG: Lytic transglycosylase, catalytic [Xanthobacteraceae bacterium]|nr:Lytic transglycosylase, catalytic [Xanthobacteraceae bacterium]